MMNKRISLTAFLAVFMAFSAYAQMITIPDNAGAPIRERKYAGVEGSPYLFDDWLKGDITLTDDKVKEDVPIRYNSHLDQVEIVNNGQRLALNPGAIKGFTIYSYNENGNRITHQFRNGFNLDSYSKNDFFQVLYDGENKLLVKLKNQLIEGANNSYGASMGDRFDTSKKYYLVKEDGTVHNVKLRRRDLKKAFPEKVQEMKAFQREQGADLGSEVGVITFLSYLEQES
jgi:hypothetical protein